jgi:hypothetical protein
MNSYETIATVEDHGQLRLEPIGPLCREELYDRKVLR